MNSDGQLDIIVACQAADRIQAALNVGPQSGLFVHTEGTLFAVRPTNCSKPTSVKVHDVDSDGKADLLISCTNSNAVHVVKNKGFPNVSEYQLATDSMPRNMALADVNGDGISDLLVPAQGANRVNIFLNKQGAGFEGVTFSSQNTACLSPYQVEVLDIDYDGKADLGVAGLGMTSGCLTVLFNQSM